MNEIPKDTNGNELKNGTWYWVRDENGRTKGVGYLACNWRLITIGFCEFELQKDDPQGLWQFEPVKPPSWEGSAPCD